MPNLALPGNPRYQPKNLQEIFGYDNLYRALAEVELATMHELAEVGIIPQEEIMLLTPQVVAQIMEISTTTVDQVERSITKHDVRAWVRVAQELLPPPLRRWLHVPLTSYDPLETGRTLQFVRAHQQVVHPCIARLIRSLASRVRHYAALPQMGRTHGQHALPITVGFWLATILYRIVWNAARMDDAVQHLVGKISGAVGAHNAQVALGFFSKDPGGPNFEARVLMRLGLRPAPISTQILPPEPLAHYLFSATTLSAALGQLGRDCRHLMRTEVSEVCEPFEKSQVGSSTMAHKRNPITFEQLEGMWLKTKNEFGKVLDTLISEHQRDLVGSSVLRDFPTIIVNLVTQLNTLLREGADGRSFIERIAIDEVACEKNFALQSDLVMAELAYIALQMAGYEGDAHELINHSAVPLAQQRDMALLDVVEDLSGMNVALTEALQKIPPEVLELLHKPEHYIGDASERALSICTLAQSYLDQSQLQQELANDDAE